MSAVWTRANCQMSYLGNLRDDRWASIRTFPGRRWCLVKLWERGCGFSPREQHCENLGEAKKVGEAWHRSLQRTEGECPLCGHKT